MRFSARASSRGRDWSGFEATLYSATAGYSEDSFEEHSVSMQVGTPLLVTSRCDGMSLAHLQVPGDLKIVPAGATRIWETERSTVKLTMYVGPTLLCEAARGMGVDPGRVAIRAELHVNDPLMEHIGWAVKSELESDEPAGRVYAEGLGLALASRLLGRYAPRIGPRVSPGLPRRRLARVREYVRANIDGDLSLFELAAVAGVGASHFKALFKRSTGVPVHQYVIRSRVEHAARLLREGDEPLAHVALQAGFANQSHLARCMRRILGATPSQVRADR